MAEQTANTMVPGNAVGNRKLQRMVLSFNGKVFRFAVNPEDYTQSEPNKATITQTKGGAWIDAWGSGIREITIKGNTGMYGDTRSSGGNVRMGDPDVGFKRWKELQEIFHSVYESVTDGEEVQPMDFWNLTDAEAFKVYPASNGLELYRSKSKPFLYQYTMHLWVVRRMGETDPLPAIIGNPVKGKDPNAGMYYEAKDYVDAYREGNGGDIQGLNLTTLVNILKPGDGGVTVEGPIIENTPRMAAKARTMSAAPQQASVMSLRAAAELPPEQDAVREAYAGIMNTRNKSKETIRADSALYASQLAHVVGGYRGRIIPPTGVEARKGLTIQEQGTISNVMPFDGKSIIEEIRPAQIPLREAMFTNRVSSATVALAKKIETFSPDVLSTAFSKPGMGRTDPERIRVTANIMRTYGSTIYDLILEGLAASVIMRTEANYLRTMLLEGMTLYLDLYQLSGSESFQSALTSLDITRYIKNIKALIEYFEHLQTEIRMLDKFDFVHELRKLHKGALQAQADIYNYI